LRKIGDTLAVLSLDILKPIFDRPTVKTIRLTILILAAFANGESFFMAENSFARPKELPPRSAVQPAKMTAEVPAIAGAIHNVGKIGLTVSNQGFFGVGFFAGGAYQDPETGLAAPSCQYPYPGGVEYLYEGAIWVGAIVGRDTLVSVGADGWQYTKEMWPDPSPKGDIIRRSISSGDPEARSEQDFIAIYTDTVTSATYVDQDPFDGRPHRPLNIEITQSSYAWSYSYAEDFVLFDLGIKNIGRKTLSKVYMGIYVDADARSVGNEPEGAYDDICGFKWSIPSFTGCGFIDTVRIAWIADNNGLDKDNQDACPYSENNSPTAVTGTRVVRTPSDSLRYSFNWWIGNTNPALDFGPRRIGTTDDPFRDFGGFLGTPEGDRNKYYVMRHEEFDYDQLFTAQDHSSDGWLPRPANAADFADGYDTRYLLSFGPFDIEAGEILPITFAYVAGADFHSNCQAWDKIFSASFPEKYYNELNFEDLGLNATWASWIYDNPGVDTDGDDYKGKYRICVYDSIWVEDSASSPKISGWQPTSADTFYYEGDGVPDFKGASPPPPPVIRVMPRVSKFNEGELVVRFNGTYSETAEDVFSGEKDFEGYRVYLGLYKRSSDFVLATSYDREDYNKYIWNRSRELYELKDRPFSLDSLRALYGGDFNPLVFPRDNPFYWRDSTFYFDRQDWNQSELGDSNLIHKVYPEEPYPTTLNLDSAREYYPDQLIDDSLFKYFEYEYIFRRLLPSQLYYVSVTAFDYGSPGSNLLSLENPPASNMIAEYALSSSSEAIAGGLKVAVFPNPYRADGNYASQEGGGFEGRGLSDYAADRIRRVHFINLPSKCTIRIFSLDGDLVREIKHDYPPDGAGSQHESWDLITRNTQAAVSGIYYWSVESAYGNQIGKLVLIM
jgi:hypothetical protein